MSQGKWWLVTCTTFGTWLPGDPRGFQTWRGQRFIPPPARYARPGEPSYRPEEHAAEHQVARRMLSERPVRLDSEQQQIAADAIVEDIAETAVIPAILAVGDVHLHLLAKFGSLRIRPAIGRCRAAATTRLHLNDIPSDRVWTRGCHMKSKGRRDEFISAFKYIQRHEQEGCVIYLWDENVPDDCRHLLLPISLDELPF